MDILLKLGIIVVIGLVGGRAANLLKLPNVSGYIVAGLLIGPSLLNVVKQSDLDSLNIINDMALAAIAFSIGNEFLIKDIKRVGKNIFIITVAEVIGAFAVVFLVMYFLLGQSLVFSMMIASMSAATAPAGIVMVIREFRANGPLTKTILPIVALDDAVGIMVFGICMSLAQMISGAVKYSVPKMIFAPLLEITGSLLLGLVVGAIMVFVLSKARHNEEMLIMTIGFVLLSCGLSNLLHVSPLLTCMTVGATVTNLKHNSNRVFSSLSEFTPPVNLLFFTVAGASLNINVLFKVGVIGFVYILARGTGKIIGATIGATMVKSEPTVVKHLGMSLLTQGGISIGLSMVVRKELPQLSDSIITVILFAVLVFEILGPILAKIALTKAGEANSIKTEEVEKTFVSEATVS